MPRPTVYVNLRCSYCSKKFKRIRWQHTQFKRRKLKKCYCSMKCKNKCQRPNWKGGRQKYGRYIKINIGKNKRIFEHRLVMEKHIGRKIRKGEVIHHINGIPTDNRIENLVLCKTHGKHTAKYHKVGRKKDGSWTLSGI